MRRGFSIIELMVSVAVIAVLLGMLLPSLSGARDTARSAECASNLRQLATAQHAYATGWKDYYACLLTSGAEAYVTNGVSVLSDTTPETPTSTNDWISPIVGLSAGFSPNRARRTKEIFERFGCPLATVANDTLYGTYPADRADFEAILEDEGYRQMSYLSPEGFNYYPDLETAKANKYRGQILKVAHSAPVTGRPGFTPRIDQVGTDVSKKILAADGTRYLEPHVNPRLDFDTHPCPERANIDRSGWYGSFVSSGAIYNASTAYGRSSPSRGAQLPLSYRHEGLRIQAAFFDGHVGSLTQTQSWAEPELWYPSGSTFNGIAANATPESRQRYQRGDKIP